MSKVSGYFKTGLLVFAISIVAAIIIGLVLFVPEFLMMMLGSPLWLMILFAIIIIPIMFIIIGWTFTNIGGFKRGRYLPRIQFNGGWEIRNYIAGPLVRPR